MSLAAGTRLGAFEISAQIGVGGMGEVYRARDTNLKRTVAIKVLPEAFAADAERLARFQREAELLASVNHPNIAIIHGLEKSDGISAVVMELVEGETLADRIERGPIPLDEALPIARQVADALEAAHERGVIHRDLKPANIKVRDDGTVKVLDFGLAKALATESSSPSSVGLTNSPTLTSPLGVTGVGVILGTAAYMAPEQAKGRKVDVRADVWAFGVVLFEMLSGRRAFDGEDTTEVLGAVLRLEPDWNALPREVPAHIRQLIRACVQKPVKQRIAHMQDVRLALAGTFDTRGESRPDTVASPVRLWQRPIPLALAAAGLLALGGLSVFVATRLAVAPRSVVRFTVPLPQNQTFSFIGRHVVAVSPDGARIAYVAQQSLWLRAIDQFDAVQVRGTEDEARSPFFSPDGQWVGFYAGNQMKKVPVAGGAPVTICDATIPFGASWGADDVILFAQPDGIWSVPAVGGRAERVIASQGDEQAHGPQRLPNSDWVLFTLRPAGTLEWDDAQIVVQSLTTNTREVVVDKGRDARYLSTGQLVYGLGGVVYAVSFDLQSRRVTGRPVPVIQSVRVASASGNSGAVQFGVADNGTLVYAPGSVGDVASRTLLWVDADGRQEVLPVPARPYTSLSLSPDGTRAAVRIGDRTDDIWTADLLRGGLVRLTTDPAPDESPLWSPRGDQVLFASRRAGRLGLYRRSADATGEEELVATFENSVTSVWPRGWSPDGRVLVQLQSRGSSQDVGLVAADGSSKLQLLLQTPADESRPTISPDGRWIAYGSNETGSGGSIEVYVQRFPELGDKRQLSTVGLNSHSPVWSRDGRALLYLAGTGIGTRPTKVMRVAVEGAPRDSFAAPQELMDFPFFAEPGAGRYYEASPKDDRLLVISTGAPVALRGENELAVVLNWFEELKRLVPAN